MNETQKKAIVRRKIFVVSIIVAIVLSFAAIMWGITHIINTGFGVKNGGTAESSHATTLISSTQSDTNEG